MTTLTLSARLDRTDSSTPWGFRMQGGRDYGSQLVITRVTPGSLAAKCGLQVGDAITKIGDSPTDSLIHKEAQQQIIRGGNSLELALQRGGTGRATHHVAAPGASPAYSTPPPQPQQSAFRPVGGEQSYNAAPKPFAPGGSTVPVAVNKQYNTPIQMYSVNNVMDSLATQTVGMNVSSDVSALKRVPSPKPPDNKPTLMTGRLTAAGPTPSAPKPLDNKPILMTGRAAGPPQSAPPPIPSQPPPMAPSGGGNRNNAAADFSETPSGKYVKAIVNNQYNTPMGLYSTTNKDDTFQTQAHGILSMIQGVDSDVMEQPNERKKIVIPSSTTAFKDSVQEPIERPKIVVSSVIRNDDTVQESTERKKIVVPSTTYKVSRSPSPYSSSEHLENNNSTKGDVDGVKSYVPSETYRLVQEEDASKDESPFSKTGPSKTQGRTFNILQKQLNEPSGPPRGAGTSPGGYKPSAPAAAPAPAPGKAPWKPQIPSGERSMRVGRVGEAKRVSQAAGRIPICNSCGVQIRGPFVSALEKTWCPDHFVCANPHCGVPLIDQGFVEEAGQLFCVRDYEQYFAPKCNKCGSAIIGDRIQASSNTYHPHCFVCCHCRQPITGNQFHTQEGEFYCAQDWAALFQTKCYGCQFPIEPGDRWVEALNQNWHSECFNCSTCQCNLEGQSFFAKAGKPYCKKHAGGGQRM